MCFKPYRESSENQPILIIYLQLRDRLRKQLIVTLIAWHEQKHGFLSKPVSEQKIDD